MFSELIQSAKAEYIYTAEGKKYLDLICGYGSVWLGHGFSAQQKNLFKQVKKYFVTSNFTDKLFTETKYLFEQVLPRNLQLVNFYSSGMEAAEYAMRLAWQHTGRENFIGFAGSVHGKSLATANLGWSNNISLKNITSLPFVDKLNEKHLLKKLENILNKRKTAAVFLEPLQASAGGASASLAFLQGLNIICKKTKTLLLFDELMTGFYRSGPKFYFSDLGFVPDLVLLGKGLGNGFPVAALAGLRKIKIKPEMLLQGTYSNNPLLLSAVQSVLKHIISNNIAGKVNEIEKIFQEEVLAVDNKKTDINGRGALWVIAFDVSQKAEEVQKQLYQRNIIVSRQGSCVRLFPPVGINLSIWRKTCQLVAELLKIAEKQK